MKFDSTLEEIAHTVLDSDITLFLAGEPGIGKSSFVEDLAAKRGTRAFVLACNQLADKADLTGARLVANSDGTDYRQSFYPHEVIKDAINYALENPREKPILLLDEINRTGADITSASLTLVTLRRIGHDTLPPNLRIVVAGNVKGNVTVLDTASLSRFFIVNVTPDAQTLMDILGDDCNQHIKNVLTKRSHLVYQESAPTGVVASDGVDDDDDDTGSSQALLQSITDSGEEMLQLTTPRTISYASTWLNNTDQAKLQEYLQTSADVSGRDITLLQEILEGFLGNTEFVTHLVDDIAESISQSTSTGTVSKATAARPGCFDDLENQTHRDTLENFISDQLNERERAMSLTYALYSNQDRSHIVEKLATVMDAKSETMPSEQMGTLIELGKESSLDHENVETLYGTSTTVSESLKSVLQHFGYAG